MAERRLFNVLQLAYTPLSNYDFLMVRDDDKIQHFINSGRIYIIGQRPVLTFEKFFSDSSDPENVVLKFEIHQRGSTEKLECEFPLFQDALKVPFGSRLDISINYTYPKSEEQVNYAMPFSSMSNFVIRTINNEFYWLSPEKLIYHYLRETLEMNIKGDVSKFLKYKVHYLGKATQQDVIKRLTGHSHLQDILSIERPFHYESLPTDEIAILFLSFQDNIFVDTYGEGDSLEDAVKVLMGELPIGQETIYLDAEKALIAALKPVHNKLVYKSYPESIDGLHPYNLDFYTFSINDPISLVYPNGVIKGGEDYLLVCKENLWN